MIELPENRDFCQYKHVDRKSVNERRVDLFVVLFRSFAFTFDVLKKGINDGKIGSETTYCLVTAAIACDYNRNSPNSR